MSAQVYSVADQTEGRKKALLEWTSIGLSSKLSVTYRGNVNCYKRVHHSIPTLPVEIGKLLQFSKQVSKISFQLSVQVYSLYGQTEGERKGFFEGCKMRGHMARLPLRTLGRH